MTSISRALAKDGRRQEEAIASECAREAITHAMAIVTAEIAREGAPVEKASLRAQRSEMARVRASLHRLDPTMVARVLATYDLWVSTAMGTRRID